MWQIAFQFLHKYTITITINIYVHSMILTLFYCFSLLFFSFFFFFFFSFFCCYKTLCIQYTDLWVLTLCIGCAKYLQDKLDVIWLIYMHIMQYNCVWVFVVAIDSFRLFRCFYVVFECANPTTKKSNCTEKNKKLFLVYAY